MKMKIGKWFRIYYGKLTGSIAFIPAIIAVAFLLLSWTMLEIDFSPWGKHLKSGFSWLSLKDASTARSIVSTVAGALISLTVFSFSLVMIVLNQAASQMSNRVLTSMIENRFQQIILGFYIGTIVYALFLLSTVRDINSGIYVPALSIYLLILLTVFDIFLFIYFLNYVTQTVKYETVIHRVQEKTMDTMKKTFEDIKVENVSWNDFPFLEIKAKESNYFQGFNEKKLLRIANEKNLLICFLYKEGTYLIKGTVFMKIFYHHEIDDESINELASETDFYKGQPIEKNADYGFSQLAEVAIKALSPGINDPATAVLTLHALSDILAYKLYHNLPSVRVDNNGVKRIYVPTSSFDEIFEKCIYPIWNYGKKDQYIQKELILMARQLKAADDKNRHTSLFDKLIREVEIQKEIEMENN
ncbi:MAG: DUF2254 domain-containing protein [Ginsengibacter sp.]